MALIGQIMVNTQVIGAWSAVRKSEGDAEDDRYVYDWDVAMNPTATEGAERFSGTLRHNYSDGALVLASYILQSARQQEERARDA